MNKPFTKEELERNKNIYAPVEITAEKIRISLMQFLDRGGKLIETEDNVLPDECYVEQVKSNPKNRR